jgi:hypothetical protein
MSLEALLEPKKPAAQRRCKVGLLLDSLDDKYREGLETLLSDDSWSPNQLYAYLSREVELEDAPSADVIRRHRGEVCACS